MTSTARGDRWFAANYERIARTRCFRSQFDPMRARLVSLARGHVVEIGAGGGQNFAFYDPDVTTDVTAIEPNAHMLRYARDRAAVARVPITIVQASGEHIPLPDASADAVLATMVLCSVDDLDRTMHEMARVLKPGGALLLLDHVRNERSSGWAWLQDALTPVQRRIAGNCHLNRDTLAAVRAAGFTVSETEWQGWGVHPMRVIIAARPA